MARNTSCVFLGEFDSIDGPKVDTVFELVRRPYNNDPRRSAELDGIHFVEGSCMVGSCVVSGKVRERYTRYICSIIARTLTSYNDRCETTVLTEEGTPVFGCFSFTLSDILARGEQRRFCLVIMHPNIAELLEKWELISQWAHEIITTWKDGAKQRLLQEYNTVANLENTREMARKTTLRSLFEIISPLENFEYTEAWKGVHRLVESSFPRFFSTLSAREVRFVNEGNLTPLLEEWSLLTGEISLVEENDTDTLPQGLKNSFILKSALETPVKPIVVWFLEFLEQNSNNSEQLQLLLHTLFEGSQIVVTGNSSVYCAEFATSLSVLLPPSLVKCTVFSDRYEPSYSSRILTFSDRFADQHSSFDLSSASGGADFISNIRNTEKCIHVVLEDRKILSVWAVDDSDENKVKVNTSTLSDQIISNIQSLSEMLKERRIDLCHCETASLKLLLVMIKQAVFEYVARGRVYRTLFQAQELSSNRRVLGTGDKLNSTALPIRQLLGVVFGSRPRRNPRGITHQKYLNSINTPSSLKTLVLPDCPNDHHTLLFLGCS